MLLHLESRAYDTALLHRLLTVLVVERLDCDIAHTSVLGLVQFSSMADSLEHVYSAFELNHLLQLHYLHGVSYLLGITAPETSH